MNNQRRSYKNFAVIGLGFGDEGKGLVTNYLARELGDSTVVRFSGGQQAGHTVVSDGVSHIFSNLGSGTLQGASTYWSKYCTFDPVGLHREIKVLAQKTNIVPELYIDSHCPVTTPYDKWYNQKFSVAKEHGTCGCGVNATYRREEAHCSLLAADLVYPHIVKMKMDTIRDYYISKVGMAIASAEDLDLFDQACKFFNDSENIMLVDNFSDLSSSHYIFEGSQGLLLDQNIGFFPHVTPSNTGTKNISEIVDSSVHTYLVTRAYQTRHGNGPMTNEQFGSGFIADNPNETNVNNQFQGTFRKTMLDLDLLAYGINRDDHLTETTDVTLVVTCLDQMKEFAYTLKGEIVICKDKKSFLKGIADYLCITEVLACSSPEGNFEEFNFSEEDAYLGEFG